MEHFDVSEGGAEDRPEILARQRALVAHKRVASLECRGGKTAILALLFGGGWCVETRGPRVAERPGQCLHAPAEAAAVVDGNCADSVPSRCTGWSPTLVGAHSTSRMSNGNRRHSSYLTAEKDNDASGSASASDGATHVLVLSHDVDVYPQVEEAGLGSAEVKQIAPEMSIIFFV